jgi:hypothetical protein
VGRCEGPAGREEERGGEARLCITSVSLQAGCDMLCDCMTAMSQVQDEQRISGSSEQQWEEFAHPAVRSLACSYHL